MKQTVQKRSFVAWSLLCAVMAWSGLQWAHHRAPWSPWVFFGALALLITSMAVMAYRIWTEDERQRSSIKVGTAWLILACIMFAFSYAMVPFYYQLCKVFKINGQLHSSAMLQDHQSPNIHHPIELRAILNVYHRAPIQVTGVPRTARVVYPGQRFAHHLVLHNRSRDTYCARIKISIQPADATAALIDTNHAKRVMKLEPHQKQDLLLRYYLDRSKALAYQDMIVGYTIFTASPNASGHCS